MTLLDTLNLGTSVVKQAIQPVIDILHQNFNPNAWFLEAKVAAAYAISAASKTQFANQMQQAVGGSINLILSTAAISALQGITSTDLGKTVVKEAIKQFQNGAPSSKASETTTATTETPASQATTTETPASQATTTETTATTTETTTTEATATTTETTTTEKSASETTTTNEANNTTNDNKANS